MTSPDEPGLRERKRRATRRAIQRAALEVARTRGLDGVTVDEIARLADVSPRTFFNYFPTKEDAILGDVPVLADDAATAWFVTDRGPLLPGLARVIMDSAEDVLADAELVTERRALGKMYPEIAARRMASGHRFEQELADLVRRRLRDEHPGLAEDELDERARLAAIVAFAFVRHAWIAWLDHPGPPAALLDQIVRSFEVGEALVASSRTADVS
jgi:AcrR family transcriptional regulator